MSSSPPPHPVIVRGREALGRGDLPGAEDAAAERLKSAAGDIDALELRYLVQKQRGQALEAVKTLDAVIGTDPRTEWAYNELVQIFMTHGRLADAAEVARTALRVNPGSAHGHNLFGLVLSEMNDLPPGEWHFRRALELSGPHAAYLTNLALNLLKQGRADEADGYFAAAHELAPQEAQTLAHWSTLYEGRGDLKRAQELLERAAAVSSPEQVSLLRANYLARSGRRADALAILDAATTLAGDAQLQRGRLRERAGRYPEAWQDFAAGKRKLAREGGGLEYKAQAVEALFGLCRQFFTRANLAALPRAATRCDVPQPIFISGFPRSGTTLVEQIVCSHSHVRPGGELTFLGDLMRLAAELLPGAERYPGNLARSWTADRHYVAALFRDYYLARAEQYGLLKGAQTFFTDKMPFNEIHLPLLKMAFPGARIVRVVRHPLDVCVSMLANNMTHGFACAYRIEDITHHLAAVFDLVEYYGRESDPGAYTLRYESLIADQCGETGRLLEYLGLPFEEGCLRFHENRRYAPTPSYAQVTEPLNDSALNRHQHYAPQLQPYVSRLAPMMTKYGYR
jgi:Tfp pilus assembly protein PilF